MRITNPDEEGSDPGPDFIKSLDRGLAVIMALNLPGPGRTLTEVATATGMSKAAARRFLHTLRHIGFVASDDRHFRLTPRVLALGYAYLSGLGLPEVAQPHLQRLSAAANESCSVSVLDGSDIVYVARVPAPQRAMALTIQVGTRLPAYATSMGRVLLADLAGEAFERALPDVELKALTKHTITTRADLIGELEQVRARGWAMVDQEREQGLRSAAAPIRDRTGRVVAAVNVSVLAANTSLTELRQRLVPLVLTAAEAIGADLAVDAPLSAVVSAR